MSNVVGRRQWVLVEASQIADIKQQIMMMMMPCFDITSIVTLKCAQYNLNYLNMTYISS